MSKTRGELVFPRRPHTAPSLAHHTPQEAVSTGFRVIVLVSSWLQAWDVRPTLLAEVLHDQAVSLP